MTDKSLRAKIRKKTKESKQLLEDIQVILNKLKANKVYCMMSNQIVVGKNEFYNIETELSRIKNKFSNV